MCAPGMPADVPRDLVVHDQRPGALIRIGLPAETWRDLYGLKPRTPKSGTCAGCGAPLGQDVICSYCSRVA